MAGDSEGKPIHIPYEILVRYRKQHDIYTDLYLKIVPGDYAEVADVKIQVGSNHFPARNGICSTLCNFKKSIQEKVKQRLWLERVKNEKSISHGI